MPSEIDSQLVRAMSFVNNFAIRALIETHPDREKLQKHFLHHVNGFLEGIGSKEENKVTANLIRLHADQLLDHLF